MEKEVVKGTPYFNSDANNCKQYPYLTNNIETEVIIVGGGVTGAIVGYQLALAGIDTVLVEKRRIAHGSTSITTALLEYELDDNYSELVGRLLTKEEILSAYKLGLSALNEIDSIVKKEGNRCQFKREDSFVYSTNANDITSFQTEYRLRKNASFPVQYFDKENNPFPFQIEAGVLSEQGGATLNPFLFCHQLIEDGIKNGLRVFENSEVLNIEYFDDSVIVETLYNKKIKGKIVIIATGFHSNKFTPKKFGSKATTFNIITEPIEDVSCWYHSAVIRDHEDPYHYLRLTPDNRVIMGGEDCNKQIYQLTYQEEKAYYEKLETRLKKMFPAFKDVKIEYRYCGTFASTNDNLGYIGRDPNEPKKWYCLGYGANGILYAMVGGMYLPKLYKGECPKELDIFSPAREEKG